MKENNRGPLVAISIVIASVVFQANTSAFVTLISPIAREFAPPPHLMSGMQISMLMTLPALLIIPAILLSGLLAKKMSKKWIMLIGWLLFGLAGLGLYFANSVPFLLSMRAIAGVGMGLVLPQPRALAAELYDPKGRAANIGYQSMGGGLASIIASLLAGVLAAGGWRYAALIFPVATVIAVIFILVGIPRVPAESKRLKEEAAQADPSEQGVKKGFGGLVWLMCIVGLVLFMVATTIQVKTTLFVDEKGVTAGGFSLGLPPNIAYSLASCAIVVGVFIGGLLFGRIFRRMKRWMFPISCLIAGAAYFLFINSPNLVVAIIASIIIGFFTIGAVMPYMTSRVAIAAPRRVATMAVTFFTFFTYGGQFLSTFFIEAIENIAKTPSAANPETASTIEPLTVSAIAFLVLGVLALIFVIATKNKKAFAFGDRPAGK